MKKIPEADIQKILGDYHAPKGLYSATRTCRSSAR